MTDTRPWAQGALVAGGLAWTGWSLWMTALGDTDGVRLAVGLSGLLVAVGLVGVVVAFPWTYGFPGGEGAGIGAFGALLFGVGQLLTGLGAGGWTTWLVAPGVLGLVGGSVMLAVGVVRVRRTPPWIGIGLAVGALVFLGFGDGSGLASLFAVPYGLAWLAVGGYLARHPERPGTHLEPSEVIRDAADDGEGSPTGPRSRGK